MILHRYKFISFYQWMYYNSYLHRNAILLKEDKEGCFFLSNGNLYYIFKMLANQESLESNSWKFGNTDNIFVTSLQKKNEAISSSVVFKSFCSIDGKQL